LFLELNNGRTLTLFDLGRIPLGQRAGLLALLKRERWGLTVAGSVVRYRRRVRMFDRIEMRSRLIGWDARFTYIEQIMLVRGVVTSQAVLRTAVTDAKGIVPTQ
ncbi:thioesterase family protein, partial [Halomonas marinisediminis]